MTEWITDHLPSSADMEYVYGADGKIKVCYNVQKGEAWKPIPKCDPYVKPKRFVVSFGTFERHCVIDTHIRDFVAKRLPTREAAECIAAFYEEVNP